MRYRTPCLAALSAVLTAAAATSPVHVQLQTSWSRPPFFTEVLETIASEVDQSFFTLLNALTDPTLESRHIVKSTDSPKDVYDLGIWTAMQAGFLWETGVLAEVEMNLALHTALPKIEAAYQYYLDREVGRAGRCESWVDWYGQVVCDGQTLLNLLELETIEAAQNAATNRTQDRPRLLPFDHIHPVSTIGSARPPHTAILYASPFSPNFWELHSALWRASKGPSSNVEYVFRHAPPKDHDREREGGAEEGGNKNKVHLGGYGVALDLKKMEYLALDDRLLEHASDSGLAEDVSESLETDPIAALIQQYPEPPSTDYSTPLTADELLQIGLQSAQLLHQSPDALATLTHLSQNFPKYASAVARRVTIDAALEEEVQGNHAKAQPGVSMVWLNGVVVPEGDMNPFGLLRLLKKERPILRATDALGLSAPQAIELLTHRLIGLAQADGGVGDGVCDASDREEGGGVVVWWNDFERDERYERWSASLSTLLTPMYPGHLPSLKLNLFNVVLAADLSRLSTLQFIAGPVHTIIGRGFAWRFGVVPVVESEEGAQMARVLWWLVKHVGEAKTMAFLGKVAQVTTPPESPNANANARVDWTLVRAEFDALLADLSSSSSSSSSSELEGVTFESIIHPSSPSSPSSSSSPSSEDYIAKARQYARRLNLDIESAPQGHVFVNGKYFELNDDFLRSMQMETGVQLQHLQEQVYLEHLTDNDAPRMSTYFYDLPTTSKRRNRFIYPSAPSSAASAKPGGGGKGGGKGGGGGRELRVVNLMDVIEKSRFPLGSGALLHPPGSGRLNVTTLVVANFDSEDGLALVREVVRSMTEDSASRYTFVHNPSPSSSRAPPSKRSPSSALASFITTGSLNRVAPAQLLEILNSSPIAPRDQVVLDGGKEEVEKVEEEDGEKDEGTYEQYVSASRAVVEILGLEPAEQVLVVNGRVVGPLSRGDFLAEDFADLMNYEQRKRIGPVVDALAEVKPFADDLDVNAYNGLVAFTSSLVSSIHLPDPSEVGLFNAPVRSRRRNYQALAGEFTKFEYGDNTTAPFHFGVLLDPLSEAAQKWSSLLEWLSHTPGVFIELHINPPRYKELPLKRFYRYNVRHEPEFNSEGEETPSTIVFRDLPQEPIYTLAMDVAPSWHVRPREASHDLDNIILTSERAHGVHATFNLDYLVIEGHAREDQLLQPPRGLQLQLTTSDSTPVADTLVVANLGYLQFRAKPGVYQFEIRPGRGREVFQLSSAGTEGWESPSVEEGGKEITLMSFEGLTLYPRTVRLPGMDGVDVLASAAPVDEHDSNFMDRLKTSVGSLFGKKEPEHTAVKATAGGQADINIFTVASGLLYERFASIMILSVLRNTKSSVKFWFIENFLSPSFLEFLPHFAEAYGFQYELVTYKWPSWLRAQKEKQRIIWAYKILFLDVLFPMDLEKVIFVDADQIVRADLKELVDLDLHGAPYGYTPMGDDNTEMEGFRFWKTGYWRDFLKGLPYHISALYVVDLVRFRQMAAGDILRTHYQQLSADPNSLANLDQDLPNNLQREVPIFSLPEDWLWCETWCSKERFDRAKTIDLCQNPLTKEPKLARAKHIPEWEDYDAEIARFAHNLTEKGVIRSGMVDADASVLADVGTASSKPDQKEVGDEDLAESVSHHLKDEL